MTITYLKRGKPADQRAEDDAAVRATVETVLADIEARGDAAVRDLSAKFDKYSPPAFRLTPSEIEAAIQESLGLLVQGKTVIAIAHRLSTIAAMDRLVVLDRGHVVESGTHAELIGANGIYAGLWARQSGGFIGQDA